jgi:hypothetical protein
LPAATPQEENAVSENVKACLGRPIVAFPDQDHIAHLQAHLAFLQSPVLGSSPLMAPTFMPAMMGHFREHIALWYAAEVMQTANDVTDQPLSGMIDQTKTRDAKQALDRLVAQASLDVVQAAGTVFAQLPPVIGHAMQMIQQMTPPTPQDPQLAAAQVAMEDVKSRERTAQATDVTKRLQLQQQGQAEQDRQQAQVSQAAQAAQTAALQQQADSDREAQRTAAEDQRAALDRESEREMNTENNATSVQVAAMHGAAQQAAAAARPKPAPEPKTET